MNRRGFFAALAGAPVATIASEPVPITREQARRLRLGVWEPGSAKPDTVVVDVYDYVDGKPRHRGYMRKLALA